MTKQMKSKIVSAMDAAGYHFDDLESTDDNLRFLGEYGSVMQIGSWQEAKEWLEGVVFDDPAVSDRVEKILHPDHFRKDRSSVLKRLEEKKLSLQGAGQAFTPAKKKMRAEKDL